MTATPATATTLDSLLPSLRELYRDLHAHPELSLQETRTAGIVAARLREQGGWEVTEGVGGTGVVGVLRSGEGPTVLLRADMDGLPVLEATGLPYASVARGTDRDGNDVPVMHACGHDMHVTCLLGVTALLAAERDAWRGTVVAVFQPAEEVGRGARDMLADGFAERFPKPDVCLGQHVGPFPTGVAVTRPGAVMAASDSYRVRLFGRGGHGSTPESTVDPVVLAAAVVMRLQTVVSREVGASQTAVVTVGSIRMRHEGEHHRGRGRAEAQHPLGRPGGARAGARRGAQDRPGGGGGLGLAQGAGVHLARLLPRHGEHGRRHRHDDRRAARGAR